MAQNSKLKKKKNTPHYLLLITGYRVVERAKPASAVHAINAKGGTADPDLTQLLSSSQGRSNRGEGYENETATLKQAG